MNMIKGDKWYLTKIIYATGIYDALDTGEHIWVRLVQQKARLGTRSGTTDYNSVDTVVIARLVFTEMHLLC